MHIDRSMSREIYSLCFGVHEWNNEVSRNKVAKLVRKARRAEDDQQYGIKIKNVLLDLDYHLCQCSQGACHDMLNSSLNGRMKRWTMRKTSKEVYKRLRNYETDKLTGSPYDCFNEPIVREGRAALAKLIREVRQLEDHDMRVNCLCDGPLCYLHG